MAYGLIENDVLIQKQYKPGEGFIGIPDDAICGMIIDAKGRLKDPQNVPAERDASTGVVIKSPNGTAFMVSVDDGGFIVSQAVTDSDL